jgi:hypothetical protein
MTAQHRTTGPRNWTPSDATNDNPDNEPGAKMSHTIVTYTVKPGREQENAALVRAVFEQLAQTNPSGFRYAVLQAAGSREFIHVYTDDGAAPGALQQLSAFQAFLAGAADRHDQPATFTEFELIGGYRTFDDAVASDAR